MWIQKEAFQQMLREAMTDESTHHGKVCTLREEIQKLKETLAELKSQKKIEEAEISHLVKMKEEKLTVDHQKNGLALEKTYQQKEMELQRDYHERVLTVMNKEHADIKMVYSEIMKRLPNVNVELSRDTLK